MEDNNKVQSDQQKSNHNQKQPQSQTVLPKLEQFKGAEQRKRSNYPDNDRKQKNKSPFCVWFKHNGVQSIIGLFTIGTLIAYIIVSQTQINQTHYSLWLADSTIKHTIKIDSLRYIEDTTDRGITRRSNEWTVKMRIKDTLAKDRIYKLEFRAYVYFKDITNIVPPVGVTVFNNATLSNIGKTPASKVKVQLISKIGTGIYSTDWELIENLLKNQPEIVIGIGQEVPTGSKAKMFNKEDSISVYTGEKKYIIYGKITYFDVFGDKRWTRFCAVFNPEDGRFVLTPKYNDAN